MYHVILRHTRSVRLNDAGSRDEIMNEGLIRLDKAPYEHSLSSGACKTAM